MAVLAPAKPLTERSATDLAGAIRTRETSSREVVEAHIERLVRMHQRINAVVMNRYDAARADADAADARVAAAVDPDDLPPILGVPARSRSRSRRRGCPTAPGSSRATRCAATRTRRRYSA